METEIKKTRGEAPELGTVAALVRIIGLFSSFKWGLTWCIFLLLVGAGLSVAKGLLIRHAIDANMGDKDWHGLLATVAVFLVSQILLFGVMYAQRMKLERIGQSIIADLKSKVFEKLLSLSLSYFDRHPTGKLMARVESDTDSLRMFFTFAITVIIGDFFLIVGMVITMLIVSPALTAIVALAAPIILGISYIYHRLTTHRFLEARKRMAELTGLLTEFIQGMSIVQMFNRQKYAQGKVHELNRDKFKLDRYAHIGSTIYFNIVFYMEAAQISAALFWGGIWLGEGLVTVGTIVMFVQYLRKMYEPIYRFSDQLYVAQKAISGAKRIFSLLECDEFLPETRTALGISDIGKGIRFENVSFAYNNDNYVLRDVSFELTPGKRIALVGVTGGGKSSIVSLMLRFYDPQRGRITIDGHDIRDMTKVELRALFGLVLQDVYLFPGDVSSNISLGAESIDDEAVIEAAKVVGADKFIDKMDGTYKARISERGSNLSRGERQLLSFARALAFDPKVLILDEATSSVDPKTESLLQLALTKLLSNRTSLIVAHRLSTILGCDEILAIKNGEIVERGNHIELVKKGGYYHHLFRLQFAETGAVEYQAQEKLRAAKALDEEEVSRV
ncbi:MAG: ABC transporter ATP-binding protein [candidate division Zixibacteria bacterium]|nr:ABC transporter ATP-binding protein [candidate division Zixibacteria bacterium]